MLLLLLTSLMGCLEYGLNTDGDDSNVRLHVDLGDEQDDADDGAQDDSDDGGDGGSGGSSGGGSGGSSSGGDDGGSSGGGSGGSSGGSSSGGDDDDDDDDEPVPGDSADNPRAPASGEIIINELMIDPDASDDAMGEWVELYNRGGAWVDLEGHRLADDDVDDYEIQPTSSDSLVVGPGDYLVICASDDYWDNGGVDCQGTILYQTWGGGFALSNTQDEVVLLTPGGSTLDRFAYGEDFAYVGSSMGVDPDAATTSGNDDVDEWCDQWSFLPMGDYGNPGEENDWCW